MRLTMHDPAGNDAGYIEDEQLTVRSPRLKQHLETILKQGLPTGPDSGVPAKPGIGMLVDYLVRAGYSFDAEGDIIEKAPGISVSGSETPDPGHVVGPEEAEHEQGPEQAS